ncbi:hypothetical protein MW887_000765 [Aspergillus wentii]|nr:hypothetical protein MW887_000765 [Aspergillus wentii]
MQKGSQVFQTCDADATNAQTVGIYAVDSVDKLSDVQEAVKAWVNGDCVDIKQSRKQGDVELGILVSSIKAKRGLHSALSLVTDTLIPRADCKIIQVSSGDSCGSLASRCGISGDDFSKYNSESRFCASLKPKQYACCSAGSLPDMTPEPQADGTCAVHEVQPDDGCNDIAGQNSLTKEQINTFNKGTKAPSGSFTGFDLAKLNQCPLKACCSGWGFCGTTDNFCTESPADTGAPGAIKNGTQGCISNCGTEVVGNEERPEEFKKVTYFEAFNVQRECLTMDVTELADQTDHTHVHFAFAGPNEDFGITFKDGVKKQFDKFVKMKASFKKILSFGGWAESTDEGTFQRYRDAVKPGNREKFIANVIPLIEENNLDGIDFDWEYPGATDIPGVPAGGGDETSNYLDFLKLIEKKLDGKSLSIALPASYWYLKSFPVEMMAHHLSYFIYMTYDLHGQWDYGNSYANPGCKAANCLRSHVNKTETEGTLAMITKAGVPASKILVGISSYGRGFGMKNATCTGPMCKFTGSFSNSTAEIGECTDTAGYISNAELNDINDFADQGMPGYKARKWHDDKSDSDIMVYGTEGEITTWVAYMSDETKKKRIEWIRDLNFGGTTDWAADLQDWSDGPGAILNVLLGHLDDAITHYNKASKGYDDKFMFYVEWVKDSIDSSLEKFMIRDGRKYMDCDLPPTNQGPRSLRYKMRDEDGFYNALSAQYGIEKDWVEWQKEHIIVEPCICMQQGMCPECNTNSLVYYNYPRRLSDASKIDVKNPKEIVNKAIPKTDELASVMIETYMEMRFGTLDADDSDVVTALSMPVFMLEDAAVQIENIKEIGEKEKETKKHELIIGILSIVFAVIPFAGEAAAAAVGGVAAISRTALIIGEAGNAAISIADIVKNPESAPFAILNILGSAAGIRAKGPRKAFGEAADARKALSADKMKLFGEAFQHKDSLVQGIIKKCSI